MPSVHTTSFFSFNIQLRSDVNSLPPHLMTSCSKFLRCRGEHDDFLIRSQERLGDSDGRARLTRTQTVIQQQTAIRWQRIKYKATKRWWGSKSESRPCPSTPFFHIVLFTKLENSRLSGKIFPYLSYITLLRLKFVLSCKPNGDPKAQKAHHVVRNPLSGMKPALKSTYEVSFYYCYQVSDS
jgi:hypothetical protein